MRTWILLALTAVAGVGTGCPSCPYEGACEGNVLKTCYLGPDQVVGSPAESERVCEGVNPECITIDARDAQCGVSATRTCEGDGPLRCDAGTLITCDRGYEVAYDCAAHGNVCETRDDLPRCLVAPEVACVVGEHPAGCDGTGVLSCDRGYVTRRECALVSPPHTCAEFTNDYGTSAYCAE